MAVEFDNNALPGDVLEVLKQLRGGAAPSVYADVAVEDRSNRRSTAWAERSDAVQQAVPDPLIVFDAAGEVRFANRAAMEAGICAQPRGTGSPRCRADFAELVELEALPGEPISGLEYKLAPRVYEVSAAWADDDLVVLLHEITHRLDDMRDLATARDAAVAARDEALAQARTRAVAMATVGHDIRSPLQGVVGLSRLLLDTELDSRQRELVRAIIASADATRAVAADVLEVSRLDATEPVFDVVEFDLADTLAKTVGMFAYVAGAQNVELLLTPRPNAPSRLLGDPTRVSQVVQNLIGNAVKYSEDGVVEVLYGETSDDFGRSYVTIDVRDTGRGIAPEAIERLFLPYTQVEESDERQHGGVGLGLNICCRLVSAMQGHIEVESEVGEGSTFRLLLPLEVLEHSSCGAETWPALVVGVLGASTAMWDWLSDRLQEYGAVPRRLYGARDVADLGRSDVLLVDRSSRSVHGVARELATLGDDVPAVIVLSSPGEDVTMLPAARHDLLRPVCASKLRRTVAQALGGGDQAPAVPTPQSEQTPLRVFLVDDEAVCRMTIDGLVRSLGGQCTASPSLDDLVSVRAGAYDLVLVDGHVAGESGISAVRTLIRNAEHRGAELPPIVGLTGDDDGATRRAWLDAGAVDMMVKPACPHRMAALFDEARSMATARREREAPDAELACSEQVRSLLTLARDAGDSQVFLDLISAFEDEMSRCARGMYDAIARGDAVRIAELAHKAAGSAGMIGAAAAERVARRLSAEARSAQPRNLGELVGQIIRASDAACVQLRALASQGA